MNILGYVFFISLSVKRRVTHIYSLYILALSINSQTSRLQTSTPVVHYMQQMFGCTHSDTQEEEDGGGWEGVRQLLILHWASLLTRTHTHHSGRSSLRSPPHYRPLCRLSDWFSKKQSVSQWCHWCWIVCVNMRVCVEGDLKTVNNRKFIINKSGTKVGQTEPTSAFRLWFFKFIVRLNGL